MIISHKNQFIFIKTAKTASSTTQYLLQQACGPNDIITPITDQNTKYLKKNLHKKINARNYNLPLNTVSNKRILLNTIRFKSPYHNKFFQHDPAFKIKRHLPKEVWDSYFKFCFERHPVSKLISKYKFGYEVKGEKIPFDQYIHTGAFYPVMGLNMYTIGGVQMVDKIFKYENLEQAYKFLSEKFNVKMDPKTIKLNDSNVFRNKIPDNQIKITKELLRIIEIAFARELKLLNYDIENFDNKFKDF